MNEEHQISSANEVRMFHAHHHAIQAVLASPQILVPDHNPLSSAATSATYQCLIQLSVGSQDISTFYTAGYPPTAHVSIVRHALSKMLANKYTAAFTGVNHKGNKIVLTADHEATTLLAHLASLHVSVAPMPMLSNFSALGERLPGPVATAMQPSLPPVSSAAGLGIASGSVPPSHPPYHFSADRKYDPHEDAVAAGDICATTTHDEHCIDVCFRASGAARVGQELEQFCAEPHRTQAAVAVLCGCPRCQ